ncbi:MAG: hypothetical protein KDB80_03840 [Planctomycetes bacterium]|nr:hypothetical protein [Planctomycetota bacterium]
MVNPPRCDFSDAVLAHFLDGETNPVEVAVDGSTRAWTGEELARHRGECDECTLQLASARRLDALLAATSDITVSEDMADTIFEGVAARLRPEVAGSSGSSAWHARWASVAAAVLCGALGFALAHWLDDSRDREFVVTDASERVPPRDVPSQPESRPGVLVLSGPRRPVRFESSVRSVTPEQLEQAFWFASWTRATALGWPRDLHSLDVGARDAADRFRLRRILEMTESLSGRGLQRLVESIESSEGELRDRIVRAVRGVDDVRPRLVAALRREGASVVRVASWLGGAPLDRAIVDFVGNDAVRATEVAEAVAEVQDRPGRVDLLLRMRDRLSIRGGDDDFALFGQWFETQPNECSHQLLVALRDGRDAEERRACLLALASRADPSTAPALFAIVEGPRQHEAELAAFALGKLPVDSDDLARRELRRGYLRVASLACRRDPIASRHLRLMRLTDEERAFLEAGRFNAHQFEIAVALCRDRRVDPTLSDD